MKNEFYITDDQQEIVDAIGFNNFLKLALIFSGEYIYFPKNIQLQKRNTKIKKEFNGNNIDFLCNKYNISKRHLYRILNS